MEETGEHDLHATSHWHTFEYTSPKYACREDRLCTKCTILEHNLYTCRIKDWFDEKFDTFLPVFDNLNMLKKSENLM